MKKIQIGNSPLELRDLEEMLYGEVQLELHPAAVDRINNCRHFLDQKMITQATPIYGINTGFGSLYNQSIQTEDLSQLQINLMRSHACGTGKKIDPILVKLMLILKVQGLAYGKSGVQLATVQRLIDFFNHDILPVVYEQGSLGASGDLAPLAHLCLPLIGDGQVYYRNKIEDTEAILKLKNWQAISLQSKEGLALLNGTQFMSALGTFAVIKALRIWNWANWIGAISLDAFDGRLEPFHEAIHQIRPHPGQMQTAAIFRELLHDSEIIKQPKKHVQDPYSFRCIPQVHGATLDTIHYASSVLLREVNSVTDNPTIFPDLDLVISAGNFHGQPLALVLDFLAIAIAELGNISERRTYQLISGSRELPHFLVANPGLNSGFMIPQYTAASIVSRNKGLCYPASVDSIVSSNGQEDHVSMGANAAVKLLEVVENVFTILAIELMNAAQAMNFRRPLKTSAKLESLITKYRSIVEPFEKDRIIYTDINKTVEFIKLQHLN